MTTATLAMRRNQNLYRTRTDFRLGPLSVSVLTIALICVLALLYLTQITKTGQFGMRLGDLNAKHDKIVQAQQELEVEAARLQSIDRIQKSQVAKSMVPEGQVTYAAAR